MNDKMNDDKTEMFDLGKGMAVHFNPDGRFHGWLFRQNPDGQYVSVKKLEIIEDPYGPLGDLMRDESK